MCKVFSSISSISGFLCWIFMLSSATLVKVTMTLVTVNRMGSVVINSH